MRFLKVFTKDLKRINSIFFLFASSIFEGIRGFVMTTGIAWGVYWMTNGCMNEDYADLQRGIWVFSSSIIFSVFALFLINFGKNKHYNKMKKHLQTLMAENVLMNEHRKKDIDDADVFFRFDKCLDDYISMYNSTIFFIGSFGKVFGGILSGFLLSWVLTCLLVVFGLCKVLIDKYVSEPLRERSKSFNQAYAGQYSDVIEQIEHIVFNRLMYDRDKLQKRYDKSMNEAIESKVQLEKLKNLIVIVGLSTEKITLMLLFVVGAVLVFFTHSINIGVYVSFISLYDMFVNPYQFISAFNVDLFRYQKSILQVIELTKEFPDTDFSSGEKYSGPFRIFLEQIYFGYTPDKLVLKNLNLCFFSGKVNYIIGASGIGKSTLIKIIGGLLHQTRGDIYVLEGEHDEKLPLYISEISYVSQIPFLFNDSIATNIGLSETVDETRLEKACKKAGLFEFIMSLDEKYQYKMIDGGTNLSAGQRYRVALARAFYHPGKIVLIDEVFANIDNITIAEINENVKALADEGRCVIFVTHRTEWIEENAVIIDLEKELNLFCPKSIK